MNLDMVKQAREDLVAAAKSHQLAYPVNLDGLSDVAKRLARKLFEAIQAGFDELPIAASKPYFNEQNSPNFNYKFVRILNSIVDHGQEVITTNNNFNGNGEIKNHDFFMIVKKLAPHIDFFSDIRNQRCKQQYLPLVYPFIPEQVGCFPFLAEDGRPWSVELKEDFMLVPKDLTEADVLSELRKKFPDRSNLNLAEVLKVSEMISYKKQKIPTEVMSIINLHLNPETSSEVRAGIYEKQEYRQITSDEATKLEEPGLAGQFGVFVKEGQSIKEGALVGFYTGSLHNENENENEEFLKYSDYFRHISDGASHTKWVVDGCFGLVPRYNTHTVENQGERVEAPQNDPRFTTKLAKVSAKFSKGDTFFVGFVYMAFAKRTLEAGEALTQYYCWDRVFK